ncbi:MAG: trehalase family glycosidase [Bacteroidota bacterium]|nr:trehalase family glycosidase [Bacteroidota bacterium]
MIFEHEIQLEPGESISFRLIRSIARQNAEDRDLITLCSELADAKLLSRLTEDEKLYRKIPPIQTKNKDYQAVYWNAFNLMRQCMMPPEGESSYNYYVFSREPTWGWGYGGQVFHESLVMLAYTHMDPESAMNSQRVYMERQDSAGFINYRTGPYLNENIPYNEQITSSAPWYNYQNYEIWKITGDREFLQKAYSSGKKYYEYYTAKRDADNDGLAEWGAHAVLESVRDARVATWDQVGWPSNFEGPDINAMLIMEAQSLEKMAEALDYMDEARQFGQEVEARTALLNGKLWDPETAFFYNIDRKDDDFTFKTKNDLKIKEIIGFLPLWAGCISQERADSLVKSLFNEHEFWRMYGVPTLSADHPYYNPIGYWNGPVWVQWNYLIFRGLLDYGYRKEAKVLAHKVLENIAYHLTKDHTFWEFYSADDLQAGWNHTYIWTGIAARFLIDLEKEGLLE